MVLGMGVVSSWTVRLGGGGRVFQVGMPMCLSDAGALSLGNESLGLVISFASKFSVCEVQCLPRGVLNAYRGSSQCRNLRREI